VKGLIGQRNEDVKHRRRYRPFWEQRLGHRTFDYIGRSIYIRKVLEWATAIEPSVTSRNIRLPSDASKRAFRGN
jgi:hypothetical protein